MNSETQAVLPSRGILSRRCRAAGHDSCLVLPAWGRFGGLDKSGDISHHAPHPKHGYVILFPAMPPMRSQARDLIWGRVSERFSRLHSEA